MFLARGAAVLIFGAASPRMLDLLLGYRGRLLAMRRSRIGLAVLAVAVSTGAAAQAALPG